ncbi:MAG: SdiA-regulated domain-containing protein [Polyangiaceae bacterium]|nr:SdiA-regulated domain-containing protein [Polyangiaceae bacterium]
MAHILADFEPRPAQSTGALLALALSLALQVACSTAERHRPAPAPSEGGFGPVAAAPHGVATDWGDSAAAGGAGDSDAEGDARSGAGSSGRALPTTLDSYALIAGPIVLDSLEGVSGVTYKPETDTFFVVSDRTHSLYEYNHDFSELLSVVLLEGGPTDTEDVAYLGDDRFAIAVETNEVFVLTVAPAAELVEMNGSTVEHYVVAAPPATSNTGFEGVTLRRGVGEVGQFFACQEGGSGVALRVLSFDRSSEMGTFSYADGTLRVHEPWDALVTLGEFAGDLSSVTFDEVSATLLVLSQETSRLLRVDPDTGDVLDERDLVGSPQYEGVTLASGGRLVLASEPNLVEVYRAPEP